MRLLSTDELELVSGGSNDPRAPNRIGTVPITQFDNGSGPSMQRSGAVFEHGGYTTWSYDESGMTISHFSGSGASMAPTGQFVVGVLAGEGILNGIESGLQNLVDTGVIYHDTALNVIWSIQNYFMNADPHPDTIDMERWSR